MKRSNWIVLAIVVAIAAWLGYRRVSQPGFARQRAGAAPPGALDSAAKGAPRAPGDTNYRALAVAAASLRRCPFNGGDRVAAGATRATYGEPVATMLEKVVAQAFPGMHLVFGHSAYLVNADGAAEEIHLLPPAHDDRVYATTLTFTRRARASNLQVEAFDGSMLQCRAPAVVLSWHGDPATHEVSGVLSLDVDEESLLSDATANVLAPDRNGALRLSVVHGSVYGTPQWIGRIKWTTVVEIDPDGLRRVSRAPSTVQRTDKGKHDIAGVVVTGPEAPDGLHFSLTSPNAPETQYALPRGPGGLPSGWMLLGILH